MKRALYASAALVAVLFPGLALAQAAEEAPPADDSSVSELIVTAQRRSEKLEDVPISMVAMPQARLEAAGAQNFLDISKVVPGVSINRVGAFTQPAIRGVTTKVAGLGAENNVAVYVDGFYRNNSVGLPSDFANVRQVEVLRGPQGTLFGRNATGGAILITTADPSFTPTINAKASYGSHDEGVVSFYGSMGVTDRLAFDVSLYTRESDGWITDQATGRPTNPQAQHNARVKLLFNATDDLTLQLTLEHSEVTDATMTNYTFYQHARLPGARDPNVTSVSVHPTTKAMANAAYLKATYDFGPVKLTSLTSYRQERDRIISDLDGSYVVNASATSKYYDRPETFTQEINLGSQSTGPFDWVAGLYFFHDDGERTQTLQTSNQAQITTQAWAAYADASWHVNDKLTLTLGGRYSVEEKQFVQSTPLRPAPPTKIVEGEGDWNSFTPRAAIRYEITESQSVYASYSQGFKSGVFNLTPNVTVGLADPEKLTAYEVGYKIARPGWYLNSSVFYYDYADIQVSSYNGTTTVLTNAASSTIYGADLEFAADLTDEFRLTLGGAYTHAEYDEFLNSPTSAPIDPTDPLSLNVTAFQDWSGNQMIRAPEWTANANLTWRRDFAIGEISLSGNLYYSSEYAPSTDAEDPITGERRLLQPDYTLLTLNARWTSPDRRWTATLYGRNVTDTEYRIGADTTTYGDWAIYGEPATFGVILGYSF
jgi:iron complex outermembrane receptor protein